MASRLRDLTYAFRRISKSPGIAVAAIVSIGLGIGANASIFSIVSTFVLRPAPVGDPGTLLALHMQARGAAAPTTLPGRSTPMCAIRRSPSPVLRLITNFCPRP